jgi:hypothetical protein
MLVRSSVEALDRSMLMLTVGFSVIPSSNLDVTSEPLF